MRRGASQRRLVVRAMCAAISSLLGCAIRYLLLYRNARLRVSAHASRRPQKNSPSSDEDGPLKRRCYSGQPARTHFGALTELMLTVH
jgi:hypothetical protein